MQKSSVFLKEEGASFPLTLSESERKEAPDIEKYIADAYGPFKNEKVYPPYDPIRTKIFIKFLSQHCLMELTDGLDIIARYAPHKALHTIMKIIQTEQKIAKTVLVNQVQEAVSNLINIQDAIPTVEKLLLEEKEKGANAVRIQIAIDALPR